MSKQALDRKIKALDALRSDPRSAATEARLRNALNDRNNYAASRAAALVGELQLHSLVPDLLAAFDRFMTHPARSDPQCWAKNAIAKALKDLGHRDAAVFLRGSRHFQPEPVWGGRQDSAATLRGTCALALVGCDTGDLEILTRLVDLLADPEKPVRIDAARAISQLSHPEGALLLRLKALMGDCNPEVTGQCFTSLLGMQARDSIAFVARFLDAEDSDIRMEAAAALAESRDTEAIDALESFWNRLTDPDLKRAILTLLGSSPLPEAARLLVKIIADAPRDTAIAAIQALARSRFRSRFREQADGAVTQNGDPRLRPAFESAFGPG